MDEIVTLMEHNQKSVVKVKELFKTHKRVGCVQPTSTGKSYVILKMIEENPEAKVLILAPTDIVLHQIKTTAESCCREFEEKTGREKGSVELLKNVTMVKYLDLNLQKFQYLYDLHFDFIFLDEFHRVGAEKWEKSTKRMLDSNPNAKVLGTTATPIRYLDNFRDMGQDLFNDVYATHMLLDEALEKKILKAPKFVPVWYAYDKEMMNKLKRYYKYIDTKKDIEKVLKRVIENGKGVEGILEEHLPNPNGRYIIFCRTIEHVHEMHKGFKTWLRNINQNIHMYDSYSTNPDKDLEFLQFLDDKEPKAIKLLFTINRFNEGFHLKDLDGSFMLRPTESPRIYFQQLGRTMTTDWDKEMVVFDFVNNYQSVKTHLYDKENEERDRERYGSQYENYDNSYKKMIDFKIFADAKDLIEVIEDMNLSDYEFKWLEYHELLKEFLEKKGRFPKAHEKYKGKLLGQWLFNQRRLHQANKLPKNRFELLKEIGVYFELLNVDSLWMEHFNLLLKYKEEFGKAPPVRCVYEDFELGGWYKKQKYRFSKGKLEQNKIDLFKKNNISLDTSNQSILWYEKGKCCLKFYKENNRFPTVNEVYEGLNIGIWWMDQKNRRQDRSHSKKQILFLKQFGLY